MDFWYAVNDSGKGNIFLEKPHKENGVWKGYAEGFMYLLISYMIKKNVFKLPEFASNSELYKFSIDIYEK